MKPTHVNWQKVVSARLAPPAVPLVALILNVDDDLCLTQRVEPVLGILTELADNYYRDRKGDYDDGVPCRPPSPRNLLLEGYTYEGRTVRMSYIYDSGEFNEPEKVNGENSADNEKVLVYPAGTTPNQDWLRYETEVLQKKWASFLQKQADAIAARK